MKLTKKVALYPNQTMTKILDNLCDYRRYSSGEEDGLLNR